MNAASTQDVVLALAALLGVATGATSLFVTRFEHRDMLRRMSRAERKLDRLDGSGDGLDD